VTSAETSSISVFVQADELWTFVHTKERHMRHGSPEEWGDSYIWMAIDSETKMVLSYLVAKREAMSAYDFIRDLSESPEDSSLRRTDSAVMFPPSKSISERMLTSHNW
jgi:hypothetical protein